MAAKKKTIQKPIWKSKTVWAAGIILAVSIVKAYGIELPMETIYGIAGSFGLYGLRDAMNKIQK